VIEVTAARTTSTPAVAVSLAWPALSAVLGGVAGHLQ
jgi:hypothetical protein